MNIYVASSWKNNRISKVVASLRKSGHNIFDFRNPPSQTATRFEDDYAGVPYYSGFLDSDQAIEAFQADFDAMKLADVCILVLPSGRSSHLEAGWFIGRGKKCYILAEQGAVKKPELMYGLATSIFTEIQEVLQALDSSEEVTCQCDHHISSAAIPR